MGISDKLTQEKLEYLRLEYFLSVLQFSLMDEKSSENSFEVFSNFIDKGLPLRVSKEGYVGEELRPHNSDVQDALIKVEKALFDTNVPREKSLNNIAYQFQIGSVFLLVNL